MLKKSKNYSEKENKKGLMIIIGLVLLALVLFVSAVAAFYSDYVSKSGDVKSGTLKLNGVYTFHVNGVETELEEIKNLNPGDVIVVECSISNTGNKSAWARDVISFDADLTIMPHLTVYDGQFSQYEIRGGADLSDKVINIANGAAATENKIINGTGDYAEVEVENTQETFDDDYVYVGASSYTSYITIYFNHLAGNDTQDKTFGILVVSQALQFRNNNATQPDSTAWAAVAGL